jgi:hypothetical protein
MVRERVTAGLQGSDSRRDRVMGSSRESDAPRAGAPQGAEADAAGGVAAGLGELGGGRVHDLGPDVAAGGISQGVELIAGDVWLEGGREGGWAWRDRWVGGRGGIGGWVGVAGSVGGWAWRDRWVGGRGGRTVGGLGVETQRPDSPAGAGPGPVLTYVPSAGLVVHETCAHGGERGGAGRRARRAGVAAKGLSRDGRCEDPRCRHPADQQPGSCAGPEGALLTEDMAASALVVYLSHPQVLNPVQRALALHAAASSSGEPRALVKS